MDNLKGVFVSLSLDGDSLEGYGFSMDADLAVTNCSQASNFQSYLDSYNKAVKSYNRLINPVPDDIQNFRDNIQTYGVDKKDAYIWYAFGVVAGLVLCYVVFGLWRKSIGWLRVTIFVSLIIVLAVSALCSVVLLLLMYLADYCMNPDANAIDYLPSGSIKPIARYYIQCSGPNPLNATISTANNYLHDIINFTRTALYTPNSPCAGDAGLGHLLATTDSVINTMTSIGSSLDCPFVQSEWRLVVHYGLCGDMFTGIYGVYLSLSVAALLLFVLCIVASILYQYFFKEYLDFSSRASSTATPEGHGEIELGSSTSGFGNAASPAPPDIVFTDLHPQPSAARGGNYSAPAQDTFFLGGDSNNGVVQPPAYNQWQPPRASAPAATLEYGQGQVVRKGQRRY